MKVGFDGGNKLEFHGAKVSSNGGLLAYRDLDYALGLFDSISSVFHDNRTGRNIQHALPTLLRQSVYSRLAGYEDVNDAEQLSVDPIMRAITGKKDKGKQAASWTPAEEADCVVIRFFISGSQLGSTTSRGRQG